MFRYHCLKNRRNNTEEGKVKKLTIPESLMATVLSTAVATFVVNPLDILITRF